MKPKVLFILHIPPPVHGAAMMGKFIMESKMINTFFNTTFVNLSTSTTIDEVGKGGINKIFSTLTIMARVSKALLTNRYDLCYMSLTAKGNGFYKDFIVVTILKLFRKKIIYHFHNKGVSMRQHKKLDNFLYKFTFKGTQTILLSSLLYPDISYYVRKKDVYYCANGISELAADFAPRSTNNSNACKLLFLSNMVAEKGVLVLLDACKLLKERGIFFECHFVGAWADVSEQIFTRYVTNNNLTNYIFAHGKKYDKDKLEFYCSSDIFVFPTFYHNECFPLVLLEAMQFSLPAVATYEGGIAEIVSDGVTGFVVSKKNPFELAGKLEQLIKDAGLREKMGIAGRKRFEHNFTLEKFEYRLTDILKQATELKKVNKKTNEIITT